LSRRLVGPVVLTLAVVVFAAMPAAGQAANLKWFSLANGVLTLLPTTATNVVSAGDHIRTVASGGTVDISCLEFSAGTVTNPVLPSPGGNGFDSLTIFAQLPTAYPALPCSGTIGGVACTLGFTTLSTGAPHPVFKSTLPFATNLVQLGTRNVDIINAPSFLLTFGSTCPGIGGTSLAYAAPSFLLPLTNLNTPVPANATAVCSGTIPSTLTGHILPGTVAQGGSGTLEGTQGTPRTTTATLDGTIDLWKVTNAVTVLTPTAQACTGLAALLTTA
jgi:hypothetical protein